MITELRRVAWACSLALTVVACGRAQPEVKGGTGTVGRRRRRRRRPARHRDRDHPRRRGDVAGRRPPPSRADVARGGRRARRPHEPRDRTHPDRIRRAPAVRYPVPGAERPRRDCRPRCSRGFRHAGADPHRSAGGREGRRRRDAAPGSRRHAEVRSRAADRGGARPGVGPAGPHRSHPAAHRHLWKPGRGFGPSHRDPGDTSGCGSGHHGHGIERVFSRRDVVIDDRHGREPATTPARASLPSSRPGWSG